LVALPNPFGGGSAFGKRFLRLVGTPSRYVD